jgi:hypothetical protein
LLGNGKQLTTVTNKSINGTIMLQAWVKPTQANGQNTTLLQLQMMI